MTFFKKRKARKDLRKLQIQIVTKMINTFLDPTIPKDQWVVQLGEEVNFLYMMNTGGGTK